MGWDTFIPWYKEQWNNGLHAEWSNDHKTLSHLRLTGGSSFTTVIFTAACGITAHLCKISLQDGWSFCWSKEVFWKSCLAIWVLILMLGALCLGSNCHRQIGMSCCEVKSWCSDRAGKEQWRISIWVCSTATEGRGWPCWAMIDVSNGPGIVWLTLCSSSFLTQLLFFPLMCTKPADVLRHVTRPPACSHPALFLSPWETGEAHAAG